MVLVFHFDLAGNSGGGFLGVDVFFVISGYLITSIIFGQLWEGSFDLRQFYANRIRRLAPALFATLVLVLLAGAAFLFPPQLLGLGKEVAAAQIYASNFYYWRTINYFGLTANSAYLLHTWSLAVEEQFYLLYPVALMTVFKVARKRVWVFIGTILLVSFFLNVFFVTEKPEATFYLLPTRAWELLIGAILARIERKVPVRQMSAHLLGFLGALMIGGAFFVVNKTYWLPGYAALVPTIGASLTILTGKKSFVGRAISNRVPVYIGKISYPLYLVHWPIAIFGLQILGGEYGLNWRLTLFFASIVLASLIYHFVELPIRRGSSLHDRKRLVIGYAIGLCASVALCGTIYWSRGMPWRFSPEVTSLAAFADDKLPPMADCEFNARSRNDPMRPCHIGAKGAEPTWFIYGDSHAWAAHDALDEWLIETKQAGWFIFQHSCPPIEGVHLFHDKDSCFDFNKAAFAFLDHASGIKKVFLISIWRQALNALSQSQDISPLPSTSVDLFKQQISRSIGDLKSMGKDVYIWEPLPTARGSVPLSMARSAAGLSGPDIAFSREEYFRTYKFFFEAMSANQASLAGRFSPSDFLCDHICKISVGGIPLYFDNNHIAASSSSFWASKLKEQIK